MKTKTLKLSYPNLDPNANDKNRGEQNFGYRVVSVGNTTEYVPHQFLTKAEADVLCDKHGWNVTVVSINTVKS